MADATTAFTGRVPEIYERTMGPVFFEPYGRDIAARAVTLRPSNVLETAAGTGRVTRILVSDLPPDTRIVATDLNPDMVAMGVDLAKDGRTSWAVVDAQSLPYPDASFDLALTQFGVMFYPDKPKAFAEVFRTLQPGGTYIFNVWGSLEDNPSAKIIDDELRKAWPDDPPMFLRKGPFGWADSAQFVSALRAAGFEAIAHENVALTARAEASVMAYGMCQGSPMRAELEARAAGDLSGVTAACTSALEAHFGAPTFDLPMVATVYTARKPA